MSCRKHGASKGNGCYGCQRQRPNWCTLCQRTPCNPGFHAHKLHRIRVRWLAKKNAIGDFCSTCAGRCDSAKHKARLDVEYRRRREKGVKSYNKPRHVPDVVELIDCDAEQEVVLALLEGDEITKDEAWRRVNRGRNYEVSLDATADIFGNTAADKERMT